MPNSITPPPELVEKWYLHNRKHTSFEQFWHYFAAQAAQWGADTELEACCEWADETGWQGAGDGLRTARRSKPKSLKERALAVLTQYMTGKTILTEDSLEIIRLALNELPDN
jgi:hypothetical protein